MMQSRPKFVHALGILAGSVAIVGLVLAARWAQSYFGLIQLAIEAVGAFGLLVALTLGVIFDIIASAGTGVRASRLKKLKTAVASLFGLGRKSNLASGKYLSR
jgi:hypothetical protein